MKVTETERPDTKIEKKTSTSQSKNDEVKRQIRVDGLPEPDASNNDTSFFEQETKNVEAVLNHLEEIPKIEDNQRIGKFDEEVTASNSASDIGHCMRSKKGVFDFEMSF